MSLALLTSLALLLPSSHVVPTSPPLEGVVAPDDDRLAEQLRSEDRSERLKAVRRIRELGSKAPKSAITPLVQLIASGDLGTANAAIGALGEVGNKTRKVLERTLESGECDGVPVPAFRAVRALCRLGKKGQEVVSDYLEDHALDWPLAGAILSECEPRTAMKMLVELAERPEHERYALEALRRLRHSKEIERKHVDVRTRKLDERLGAAVQDAFVDVDPAEDLDRMKAWLTSGEPAKFESALWSVGLVGEPFIELAPDVSALIESESGRSQVVAIWALASLGEEGATCEVPGVFEPRVVAIGGGAPGAQPPRVWQFLSLRLAKDGLVPRRRGQLQFRAPTPRPATKEEALAARSKEFTDLWTFAATWHPSDGEAARAIEFMSRAASSSMKERAAEPMDERLAPYLETVLARLDSDEPATRDAAGAVLTHWGHSSDAYLNWILEAGARGVLSDLDADFASFIRTRGETLVDNERLLIAALGSDSLGVAIAEVLVAHGAPSAHDALTEHLVSRERPWVLGHHAIAERLVELDGSRREALDRTARERFLAGDLMMASRVARQGEAAHDVIRTALVSEALDTRMIAVAAAGAQGTAGAPLEPALSAVAEREPHFADFVRENLRAVRGSN